jgi:carboxypeptidase PM20D1
MKKILILIILFLISLFSVLLFRTYRLTSKQIKAEPAPDIVINRDEAANRLAQSIKFKTISYQNPSQTDTKEFQGLIGYLEQAFPKTHSSLNREVLGNSLLYTWKGSDAGLKPILLMGHMDVVPVEPGSEKEWQYPPFEGRIADGYIWGRGTMDDKVGVVGTLEAVELLLKEGLEPKRTIFLAFGEDEEVGGNNGAVKIAALLQSRGISLEYVLDEGGIIGVGMMKNIAAPIALVGIAEKGYLSLELTAQSEGGHSSMPPRHTAAGILSAAIVKLEENPATSDLNGTVAKMLDYLGPEMPLGQRLAIANKWLFGWVIDRQFSSVPTMNALIRTTTAVTMLEGSPKENVLPIKARAVVNFRIRPGDSVEGITKYVGKTINDSRIQINIIGTTAQEPSKESSTDSPAFQTIQKTIRQLFPTVVVSPFLVVGATDSRHYSSLSNNIYRFMAAKIPQEDASKYHGMNERISIESYEGCVKFYYLLIRNSV